MIDVTLEDNDEDSETILDENTEDFGTETNEDREKRLESLLTRVNENTSQSETLAKIVSDPDVMAVLKAKQSGEKVSVTVNKDES